MVGGLRVHRATLVSRASPCAKLWSPYRALLAASDFELMAFLFELMGFLFGGGAVLFFLVATLLRLVAQPGGLVPDDRW